MSTVFGEEGGYFRTSKRLKPFIVESDLKREQYLFNLIPQINVVEKMDNKRYPKQIFPLLF